MLNIRRFPVIWLVLAAILYRSLIPAGFMPAGQENGQRGALLAICHHGELEAPGHGDDGKGSPGASLDQCPFGVAAAPALPGADPAIPVPPPAAGYLAARLRVRSVDPTLGWLPPATGPPALS